MLGQVRLHFPQWGDNAVTGWVPVLRRFSGHFALPDVGDHVLVMFVFDDPSYPVVIGGLRKPGESCPTGTNKGNHRKIFSSKSGWGTIIMDDTPDGERIEMSAEEGKIRIVLDPKKGIEMVNEVGDIEIKGKKIEISGDEEVTIKAKKKLTIESGENLTITAKKNVLIEAGGDLKLKGSEINIEANSVTAGKKAVAKKDDKVIGIDFHKEWVQAGPSRIQVPIPNPFQGKLADKLSKDVKIKGKEVAVKGSKAKNEGHKVIPPGDSFVKPPKDEGKVSNGTVPKVKVNGKEIAVLGSTVTCCDDLMIPDAGKIIASGSAEQPPIKIPEAKPIDRSLQNPKWGKSEAKVGEMIALNVQLKNQYEGANVKFKIFPEGADVNTARPLAVVWGKNEGGKANAEWKGYLNPDAKTGKPAKESKYIYTAESFGCAKVQAGSITVKKPVPEFSNMKWMLDDKEVKKTYIGTKVKLTCDVKNLEAEADVVFNIYEKDKTSPDDYVGTVKTKLIEGKKLESEWEVIYMEDDDDEGSAKEKEENGYTLPEYVFHAEVKEDGTKGKDSPLLNTQTMYEINHFHEDGKPAKGMKFKVFNYKNEEIYSGELDDNGYAKVDNVIHQYMRTEFIEEEKEK